MDFNTFFYKLLGFKVNNNPNPDQYSQNILKFYRTREDMLKDYVKLYKQKLNLFFTKQKSLKLRFDNEILNKSENIGKNPISVIFPNDGYINNLSQNLFGVLRELDELNNNCLNNGDIFFNDRISLFREYANSELYKWNKLIQNIMQNYFSDDEKLLQKKIDRSIDLIGNYYSILSEYDSKVCIVGKKIIKTMKSNGAIINFPDTGKVTTILKNLLKFDEKGYIVGLYHFFCDFSTLTYKNEKIFLKTNPNSEKFKKIKNQILNNIDEHSFTRVLYSYGSKENLIGAYKNNQIVYFEPLTLFTGKLTQIIEYNKYNKIQNILNHFERFYRREVIDFRELTKDISDLI